MKIALQFIIALFIANGTFGQTENFWTKKADFGGLKRERAVSFTIGNYAYVGTGIDTTETVLKDFWKYDAALDTWTQIATLPGSKRRNAIAFSIGNYGYVGTGMNEAIATSASATPLNDFYQYDPALNSWTPKATFQGGGISGLYFATGFAIDSKGYVCGGKIGPNNYTNELWEYKQALDQWVQLPNFPGGVRYQLASFVIDFKAYIGLGTDQDLYRKDIWEFDATSNLWTAKSDLPSSERASTMTFTIGQRGYVCMGGNGGLLDDLWQYNPFNDSWSPKASYGGSSRKNGIGFAINGKGYVGTGKGYSGKKASMHQYTPNAVLDVNDLAFEVAVYPNPATDYLTISYENPEIQSFELYSLAGRKVFAEDHVSQIDVQDYQSGSYILVAKQSNGAIVAQQTIIIQ